MEPDDGAFEEVLARAVEALRREARERAALYASLSGSRLAGKVCEVLGRCAEGTPFEGAVRLVSGQRFPDIVVGGYYGVEVKTTQADHWKSTGSSVAEGTRVEGVERIYGLMPSKEIADIFANPMEELGIEEGVIHF